MLHSIISRAFSTSSGPRGTRISQTFSLSKRRLEFVPPAEAAPGKSAGAPWSVVDHSTSTGSSGWSLVQHFLPKNYPHSVSSCYANFSSWQAAQMVVSSASGVLTMQSLLFAIGVGAGSVPMAAALNWILKDGIGQLGAIIFGSWAGNRFDSDPKRFRMLGCVAQDTSHFLEALTPLAPHLFLPLASLANGCKNITWFAASSTRAAINKSMCLSENLADVTGKAVSQSIASSLAGTALGIGISTALTQWAPVVGSTAPNPLAVLATLVPLAGLHWYCCYKSLAKVSFNTLNMQRFERFTVSYIESADRRAHSCTPQQMADVEVFMQPSGYRSMLAPKLRLDARFDELFVDRSHLDIALRECGTEMHGWKHAIKILPNRDVALVIMEGASSQDVLRAFFHSFLVRHQQQSNSSAPDAVQQSAAVVAAEFDNFVLNLHRDGWNTEVLFLETDVIRLSIGK